MGAAKRQKLSRSKIWRHFVWQQEDCHKPKSYRQKTVIIIKKQILLGKPYITGDP